MIYRSISDKLKHAIAYNFLFYCYYQKVANRVPFKRSSVNT
jgi:hypothetical protein